MHHPTYKPQNHHQPYLDPASFLFLLPVAKLSSSASRCVLAAFTNCCSVCLPGAIARTGLCCCAARSVVCNISWFAAYSLSVLKCRTRDAAEASAWRPKSCRRCALERFRSSAMVLRVWLELCGSGYWVCAWSWGTSGPAGDASVVDV